MGCCLAVVWRRIVVPHSLAPLRAEEETLRFYDVVVVQWQDGDVNDFVVATFCRLCKRFKEREGKRVMRQATMVLAATHRGAITG